MYSLTSSALAVKCCLSLALFKFHSSVYPFQTYLHSISCPASKFSPAPFNIQLSKSSVSFNTVRHWICPWQMFKYLPSILSRPIRQKFRRPSGNDCKLYSIKIKTALSPRKSIKMPSKCVLFHVWAVFLHGRARQWRLLKIAVSNMYSVLSVACDLFLPWKGGGSKEPV